MTRERCGRFFTEGLRFVAQAARHPSRIETLVVAPEMLLHPFGRKLLREQRRLNIPCLEVTPEIFVYLSLAEEPQWIGAVVRQRRL